MAYYKFLCKDTNVGLTARSCRWFATKISTLIGCIFEQNLALKSTLFRPFASKFNSSPEALEVEGEIILFRVMECKYRELTPDEVTRAMEQKGKRTIYERRAYRLLPDCMKSCVERNPPIAFAKLKTAYYPDLFFRDAKICVEIDGGYHHNRRFEDYIRDKTFKRRGFIIIRILNGDTRVDVAFWQRLLEGLEKSDISRDDIQQFMNELRKMIEDVTTSCSSDIMMC